MNLLFITARFPVPPIKGDQVVPYYRMKLLHERHNITLLTLYQNDNELKYLPELKPLCKEVIAVKLSKYKSVINMIFLGFFLKLPFQVLYFHSKEFKQKILSLIESKDFDIVHTYTLRMAEYVKDIRKPKILDLIDSMQLNFERRVATDKFPLKIIMKEELRRLRMYENDIVDKFDKSIVVSSKDRSYITSNKVVDIDLGLDTQLFKRTSILPNNKTIIFSGNMGYAPNENAILWFLKNCFPLIKKEIPEVKLIIAGNNPNSKIKKYHDGGTITVTGFVDSISHELNKAQISIAPMQSGSGMQFKILEAMACEMPVVATKLGLGAIAAVDKENILIADNVLDFAKACIMLLGNYELSKIIGTSSRGLIRSQYSWESNISKVEDIYNIVMQKYSRGK